MKLSIEDQFQQPHLTGSNKHVKLLEKDLTHLNEDGTMTATSITQGTRLTRTNDVSIQVGQFGAYAVFRQHGWRWIADKMHDFIAHR